MNKDKLLSLLKELEDRKDVNNASIVSNEREYVGERGEYLEEANLKSFAPFETGAKDYPFYPAYPDHLQQEPTRDNYDAPIKQYKNKSFPLSGLQEHPQDMAGTGFITASNNSMKKYSYILDMSYDVSDLEKQKADKAVLLFDQVIKDMYKACEFLDLMKQPFEKDSNITTDEVLNIRAEIREYRDNILEKFNIFKGTALQCLNIMEIFSNDTEISKLMKSFIVSIEEIEEAVNELMNVFADLNDPEFVKNVIKWIGNIQLLCDSLEDVIYNRIVRHIKSNILATTWADSISTN